MMTPHRVTSGMRHVMRKKSVESSYAGTLYPVSEILEVNSQSEKLCRRIWASVLDTAHTDRHREIDRHRQKQTGTNKQTDTDRDRKKQTDTDRTQSDTERHKNTQKYTKIHRHA
jgi:hypothetical protein